MIETGFALLLLLVLYLLKGKVQQFIQGIIILSGGSKILSLQIYSLIFLPGVILHELSHFITAAFLGVPTGDITIFPKLEELENGAKRVALGTVKVAKTDFIRGSLIGLAPILAGTLALYTIAHLIFSPLLVSQSADSYLAGLPLAITQVLTLKHLAWLYLTFTFADTMFMSREDTRSLPVLIIFLILIAGIAYTTTDQLPLIGEKILPVLIRLARGLTTTLLLAVTLNLTVLIGLGLMVQLLQKIRRKKLVFKP